MRLDHREELPNASRAMKELERVVATPGHAEPVASTFAIVAINGWNRIAVGFRQPVGTRASQCTSVAA